MTAFRSRLVLPFAGAVVVLAAIATLLHIYLAANAANQLVVCQQEYRAVQAGLDAYKAAYSIDTVPGGTNTADMTTPVLLYNGTPSATRPTYVRNSPTRWAYTWDTSGRITAIWQANGGPAIPPGCVVLPPA
jgi:YD repeat-containing protein